VAGGISVTPEQLQSISTQISSGSSEIDAILAQLRNVVAPLQSDWVGAAQAQFEELFLQWQSDANSLQQALDGIAALTMNASNAYAQTEQSIATSFSQ
jgi:WXG100 family type VII secretion target